MIKEGLKEGIHHETETNVHSILNGEHERKEEKELNEDKIEKELNKDIKDKEEDLHNVSTSTSNTNNTTNNNTSNTNTSNTNNNLANITNSVNNIINKNLNVKIIQPLDKPILEVCKIIIEFISHFANFDLDIHQGIDLILEISTKYNVPSERINYYVSLLNSSVYTIKNTGKGVKTIVNNNNYIKKYGAKLGILYKSCLYTHKEYLINLLILNKQSSKTIQKRYYKHLLLDSKEISMKDRLSIWNIHLKTVNILK